MQGSREVCLLYRGVVHSSRTPFTVRRAASSRATKTYDASKLVLDLDAADSKYVRRYEDSQQLESAPTTVLESGDAKLNDQPRPREEGAWDRQQQILDIHRALGLDLLMYSLVPNPWRKMSPTTTYLRKLLAENQLSPRLGTFRQHLDWLLAVSKNPYMAGSENGNTCDMAFNRFEMAVGECQSLYEVTRIVTLFTTSKENCAELAANGWVLVEAIVHLRRAGSISVTRSLKFINAVVQKLELIGVDPGLHLCEAGMYYAAKAHQQAALKKYITLALQNNYPVGSHRAKALGVAVRKLDQVSDRPRIDNYRIQTKDHLRDDLLTLITGWAKDGVPQEGEKRQACFALLLDNSPVMTETYLISLAKLGATAALSRELHLLNIKQKPSTQALSGLDELTVLSEQITPFIHASVQGKNPIQAFEFLEYLRKHMSDHARAKPTILDLLDPPYRVALSKALKAKYRGSEDVREQVARDLKRFGVDSLEYVDVINRVIAIDR